MSSKSREEPQLVLFGRLKKAITKLKILLKFDSQVFRLVASLLGSSSSKVISFRERPRLTAAYEDSDSSLYSPPASLVTPSPSPSPRKVEIKRTISRRPSLEDDIDNRAEICIANFRRQLQIERQVSLDLKYCREKT